MLDKRLFAENIAVLFDTFEKIPEKVALDLWYDCLKELTDDQFLVACRMVFEEERFMPCPAEFRSKVLPSQEDIAMEDWTGILNAVRRGTSPEISTAGGQALRTLGGVRAIGQQQETQLPWLRRDFLAARKIAAAAESKKGLLTQAGTALIAPESASPQPLTEGERMLAQIKAEEGWIN